MKKSLMFLSLVVLLSFSVSCQNQQAIEELEEMTAQAEVEEQNKETVLRLYEDIDSQKFEEALEAFAPDAQMYGSGEYEPINPQEFRRCEDHVYRNPRRRLLRRSRHGGANRIPWNTSAYRRRRQDRRKLGSRRYALPVAATRHGAKASRCGGVDNETGRG